MEIVPHMLAKRFPLYGLQQIIHEPCLKRDLSHFKEIVHRHVNLVLHAVHFDAFETGLAQRMLQMTGIREPFLPGEYLAESAAEFLLVDE